MKMVQLEADNTVLYNKPEKNIVYMFSELIDNAKSSYEEKLKSGDTAFLPIYVRFDAKNGLISVEDEGTGFEILKAIKKIGRDKPQTDETNQYYQGMKNAMTWFGDYAIVISERELSDGNHKFVNLFIPYKGVLETDLELKATGKTGSKILVFKNFLSTKEYWRTLDFVDKGSFSALNEDDIDRTRYTNTERILDDIENIYPYLTASLFQRYSPVVNKHPNLKINFSLFGKDGQSKLHGDNFNGYVEDKMPVYFSEISSNNFDMLAALSFEEFKKENSKFYEQLENNKDFRNDWKEFFVYIMSKDFKTYFNNYENTDKTGPVSRWPGNLTMLNEEDFIEQENDSEVQLKDMEGYPFAQKFGNIFMNMFMNGKGSFGNLKFKLENMTINNAHIVAANRSVTTPESQIFDILFSLNVGSDKFYNKEFDGKFGKHKVNQISGFKVIQNERAIYHGPNFKGVEFNGVMYPENILVKELVDPDNYVKFPNSWKKNSGTEPSKGGNTEKITNKIYGEIFLANDENFSAGTNKAQIDNMSIFTDFFIKLLMDSGLAIISKWDKLLKNNFDSEIIFTSKFNKMVNEFKTKKQLKPKNPVEAYAQFISRKDKKNDSDKSTQNAQNAVSNYSSDLDKNIVSAEKAELESVPVDNLADITKRIMLDFRIRKQDNLVSRNFGTLSQEKYTILINLKGRSFNSWKRQIKLIFEESFNSEVKVDITENLPINIVFPISFKSFNQEELRNKLSVLIDELISTVVYVNGFDKVLVESNDKIDANKAINKYLKKEFNKLNNIIDEEEIDENI